MKKSLAVIDILKLFFAIGVLAIHAKVFDSNDTFTWTLLHAVFRLAVPFFFVASGYFFYLSYKKNSNLKETTKKYIKRLMIPLIFWLTLNLPVVIYNYLQTGDSVSKIIKKLMRDLIFYPWGAMWYVLALIIAIIIISPFFKKNKLKLIVLIGFFLYLFALVCNTYYFIIAGTQLQKVIDSMLLIIKSARNGLFEGVYFVSVGMYIAKLSESKLISNTKNNIVFIISYMLLIVEILLTKNLQHRDDHSLFITYAILIPSIFIFLTQFNLNIDSKRIRSFSTGIYFSHRFVLGIITIMIKPYNSILAFLLSLTIIVLVLGILYKVNNRYINYVIK